MTISFEVSKKRQQECRLNGSENRPPTTDRTHYFGPSPPPAAPTPVSDLGTADHANVFHVEVTQERRSFGFRRLLAKICYIQSFPSSFLLLLVAVLGIGSSFYLLIVFNSPLYVRGSYSRIVPTPTVHLPFFHFAICTDFFKIDSSATCNPRSK
jgi:hypothetical protein